MTGGARVGADTCLVLTAENDTILRTACSNLAIKRMATGRWTSARRVSASKMSDNLVRCDWARNELAIIYHDREWGVPQHDDDVLFEFLILEGAQAGLSWDTILRKRENYRAAFDNFDVEKISHYNQRKMTSLMRNEGIIRNRLKILSAVKNAKAFLRIQNEFSSFDRYVWQFVGGKPKVNALTSLRQLQARTTESDTMSKDMKRRGFTFVGSTICYAFMQAVGMVNDHMVKCFRYRQV